MLCLKCGHQFGPHHVRPLSLIFSTIHSYLLPTHTTLISSFHSDVNNWSPTKSVSYTHLRAHETPEHLVCRLLLEKKKNYFSIFCVFFQCTLDHIYKFIF
eukprot:TRINITY_DN41774_c0_g1_i1.p1 TRINITY_DN41774_c0_g1~~TRINITY_DN41774_c0_g1_i1.p1  ORF type:complete len:100 (-),score=12.84 TRINITY_DN41774_c0_g1_i1:54-353(-)